MGASAWRVALVVVEWACYLCGQVAVEPLAGLVLLGVARALPQAIQQI